MNLHAGKPVAEWLVPKLYHRRVGETLIWPQPQRPTKRTAVLVKGGLCPPFCLWRTTGLGARQAGKRASGQASGVKCTAPGNLATWQPNVRMCTHCPGKPLWQTGQSFTN